MSRRLYLLSSSVLGIVIFLLAMVLSQSWLSGARLDFTQGQLYSLSSGTKTVLGDLAEPVDVTFVYSRRVGQDYPAVRAYAARVRELLAAYDSVAGRRLNITEIDPQPFSEAEDQALAAGITAISTNGGDPLYFGIIGRNAVDDEAVLAFLAPEREASLEYDLTRLISRLDNPDPATVGIITSLPGMAGDGRETGYFVLQEIAKTFRIEQIPETFVAIPESVNVLVLAHPADLNPYQAWLVDQFVLRKGRLLALVDPAAKAAGTGSLFDVDPAAARSGLGQLGRAWGVTLAEDAVADVATALPVEADVDGTRTAVIGQPLFIAATPSLMNDTDLATADLARSIHFGAPGALLADPADGATFSALVTTSPSPAFIDAERAARDMPPSEVVRAYVAGDEALVLAGRLSGSLQTAFPTGAPPLDIPDDPVLAEVAIAEAGRAGDALTESAVDAQIVIVADADVLDDGFYVNPQGATTVADNAVFILNALDGLAGGDALLSLRARAPGARPMTTVDHMRARAEARYFDEQARLEASLERTQRRLEELQAIGSTDGFYAGDLEADLTAEERAELADLRTRIVETRARLRGIERDFRQEIDGLEGALKAVNIWGGAFVVALIGLFVWWRGRRRATA